MTLNPNYSTAHHFFAQLLVTLGRFGEAAEEIELARRIDPLAPSINAYVPYIYLAARDYKRAIDEGQRAVDLEPQSPLARWHLGGPFYLPAMSAVRSMSWKPRRHWQTGGPCGRPNCALRARGAGIGPALRRYWPT